VSANSNHSDPKIGVITATSLVIANMVGTGVFTSLGFQVLGIQSVFALLMLWVVGGVVALCGALTYAELAVTMPRSGGEYRYLSNLYHPSVGLVSGWISSTLGFAGPVAISSMAFGEYFSNILDASPDLLAVFLLIVITLINLGGLKAGGYFQTGITFLNLFLIVVIIISGIVLSDHSHYTISLNAEDIKQSFSAPFYISLVYVSFAYSGWNSAAYIAGEIKNPRKNLPIALFSGTIVVMFLYLLLNFIFLYSTPIPQLSGQVQIAFIAAKNIFGEQGAIFVAFIISIGLTASVNSMMFTGPRVTRAIGEDFPVFKKMTVLNSKGSPMYAVLLQFTIALILIFTSSFEQVMTYIGFTLSLFTTLTVAGVFINRYKNPKHTLQFKTPGYPVVPLLFIALEVFMMVFLIKENTVPSMAGLITAVSGFVVYLFVYKK